MSIGKRIRTRRLELNMSQEELALKIGYSTRSAINKIEQDARNLKQDKIKPIAEALDTTVEYIMGWDERTQIDIEKLNKKNQKKLEEYFNLLLNSQD